MTDTLSTLFEHGIDVDARRLYLVHGNDGQAGEVGPDLAALAVMGLQYLDKDPKPIEIILNSTGGDEYCMLAIFDAIKRCNSHVTITVYGSAMSAGAFILQAGQHRRMSRYATLMAHFGTIGVQTQSSNLPRVAAENERLATVYRDVLLSRIRQKRPRTTAKQLAQLLSTDWYLSAEESVSWGLADEVMG